MWLSIAITVTIWSSELCQTRSLEPTVSDTTQALVAANDDTAFVVDHVNHTVGIAECRRCRRALANLESKRKR
jgi:hypothetical protein